MAKEIVEAQKNNANQHILNIITPSGIDFTSRNTNLGDNFGRIYSIVGYPMEGVNYGWLSALANLEGTSTFFEYHYSSAENMIEVYNKKISELKGDKAMAKVTSEIQVLDKRIEDFTDMVREIAIKESPVGYLNILLHIQAPTEKMLENRIKRVNGKIAVHQFRAKLLTYKQLLALKAISPYGIPNEDVSKNGDRNMTMNAFLGGYPMASSGINDKNGFYIGKTKENKLIILNIWQRGNDRVNSNWFVTGLPGSGKSTFLKLLYTKLLAMGTKLIILDPEHEYVDLAKHKDINGQVIDGLGGKNGRINPLQIRKAPIVQEEDLEDGENLTDFYQYEDTTSDMAIHIQGLRIFFKQYFGAHKYENVQTKLEELLIETYNKHQIFWDTDPDTLTAEAYPIMEELYFAAEEKKKEKDLTDYDKNLYSELRDLLYPIGVGADKFIWNGPTTIDAKADFVDIDCSGLLEADAKVQRAQFYNLTSWAWQQMSKDRNEKIILGVDEGYLYVDPDYPDLMKFMRNISKRDRKYEAGFLFITHSVVDVLDPAVKRFGQAIIDNSCYKFIMGTDGKNLEETKKLFNLTEQEEMILSSKQRGEGILFAGSKRMKLKVDVREYFLEMFGTAGGR